MESMSHKQTDDIGEYLSLLKAAHQTLARHWLGNDFVIFNRPTWLNHPFNTCLSNEGTQKIFAGVMECRFKKDGSI